MSANALIEGLEEVAQERDLQAAAATYDAVVRRPNTPTADLSAKQLRQAISLGSQMAERDALLMLAMKARQVAAHDRRRPRLVYSRPTE